jgi:YggT family protein
MILRKVDGLMGEIRAGSRGHTERAVVSSESRRPAEAIVISIVYFIFGVIQVILGLRFLLRLLGANPDAGFVQLVYTLAAPFMAPFEAVFATPQVEGAVFDWSVLLAMAVYALIAWGIASLIRAVTPRSSAGTVEQVEHVETAEETEEQRAHT